MKKIRKGRITKNEINFSIPSFPALGVKCKTGKSDVEYGVYEESYDDIAAIEIMETEEMHNKYIRNIYIVLGIISAIISIIFDIYAFSTTMALIIFDIINRKKIAEYILDVVKFNQNSDYKDAKEMHAAMHMGIAAFNELERTPTKEEIKQYSFYTENCSFCRRTREIFPTIVTWICGSLVPSGESVIMKLICAMIFLIVMIVSLNLAKKLKSKGMYKYLAFYSMKKPTDKEIELVISALNKIEEIEKNPDSFANMCKSTGIPFNYVKVSFGYVDKEYSEAFFI